MAEIFENWVDATFERWLAQLTHQEIARALKALTRDYVQRRTRLRGKALDGRGKRAAFALYYGMRHFILVREVVAALDLSHDSPAQILDLGCGTGVGGAAWGLLCAGEPKITGVDLSPDLLREAALTYRTLELSGRTVCCHLSKLRWPRTAAHIIAAFTINELDEAVRERVWGELVKQKSLGGRTLIVEPLATRITPWWCQWAQRAEGLGGRADEFHFEVELPERVHLLGKSAGLRPERLGARTLCI